MQLNTDLHVYSGNEEDFCGDGSEVESYEPLSDNESDDCSKEHFSTIILLSINRHHTDS